jgi:hypothetical protein
MQNRPLDKRHVLRQQQSPSGIIQKPSTGRKPTKPAAISRSASGMRTTRDEGPVSQRTKLPALVGNWSANWPILRSSRFASRLSPGPLAALFVIAARPVARFARAAKRAAREKFRCRPRTCIGVAGAAHMETEIAAANPAFFAAAFLA